MHFTPTSSSWLNLVERWFGLITKEAIRRGSFDSVAQLERAINAYLAEWNDEAKPFTWTKTPGQILWRIQRTKARYWRARLAVSEMAGPSIAELSMMRRSPTHRWIRRLPARNPERTCSA
jgi:hypothetical protein